MGISKDLLLEVFGRTIRKFENVNDVTTRQAMNNRITKKSYFTGRGLYEQLNMSLFFNVLYEELQMIVLVKYEILQWHILVKNLYTNNGYLSEKNWKGYVDKAVIFADETLFV